MASDPDTDSSAEPSRRAPLLERESELAELAAAVRAAAEGAGRLVVLEGTAGIGKSRLARGGPRAATADGLRVLAARGGEFEAEFAYGIVRQLFEPLLAAAPAALRSDLFAGPAALVEPLFDPASAEAAALADTTFADPARALLARREHGLDRPTLHRRRRPSLGGRGVAALAPLSGAAARGAAAASFSPRRGRPTRATIRLFSPSSWRTRERRSSSRVALGVASIERLAREEFGLDPDEAFCAAVAVATGGNPLFAAALLDTVVRERIEPAAASARARPRARPARDLARGLAAARRTAGRLGGARASRCDPRRRHGASARCGARRHRRRLGRQLRRPADPCSTFSAAPIRSSSSTGRAHRDPRGDRRRAPDRDAPPRCRDPRRRGCARRAGGGAPRPGRAGRRTPRSSSALRARRDGGASRAAPHEAAVGYLGARSRSRRRRRAVRRSCSSSGSRSGRLAGPRPSSCSRPPPCEAAPTPNAASRRYSSTAATLFYANRPGRCGRAASAGPSTALDDADPDLREQVEAELVGLLDVARRLLPARGRSGSGGSRRKACTVGSGRPSCWPLSLWTRRRAAGSRELAIELAQRALAMPGIAHEGTVGVYYALNALVQAGETEVAYAAYSGAVERARRDRRPLHAVRRARLPRLPRAPARRAPRRRVRSAGGARAHPAGGQLIVLVPLVCRHARRGPARARRDGGGGRA